MHLHAISLNMMAGGVRVGIGAGVLETDHASGTIKVHVICAGGGLPLIESYDDSGNETRKCGDEPGVIIGCLCCRGRTDSAVPKCVATTNGTIGSRAIKSDASDGTGNTKSRTVHCHCGKEI